MTKTYDTEYIPPILTVDGATMRLHDGQLQILLIKRHNDPFKNAYALPGGYNPQGETTLEATTRILHEKAGVRQKDALHVEQLYTFDTVARDPRGHAVAVAYLLLGRGFELQDETSDEAHFFDITTLPELAFDHGEIINLAHSRLKHKIMYSNIMYSLLPKEFTLTELQQAYEIVLGRKLDKRNFRKKYLTLDLISETGEMSSGAAHRPAKLYKFNAQKLEVLERSFD